MELEDLKPDDYYYAEYKNSNPIESVIVKGTEGKRSNIYINNRNSRFWLQNKPEANQNIRLATLKEIHWIEECIRMKVYVSFEEAMESFHTKPIEDIKDDPELNEILIRLLTIK